MCSALADITELCVITCRVNAKTQIRAWRHQESEEVKFMSPAYSCSVTHFILRVTFVTLCPLVRISSTNVTCCKGCVHLHRGKRKSGVPVEEQLSSCTLCQDVLKDPVSTSCGHWFCRQCITSYWEQRPPSGDPCCPQCGERSRTRAGLQTASQTRTVTSKTEHLSRVSHR